MLSLTCGEQTVKKSMLFHLSFTIIFTHTPILFKKAEQKPQSLQTSRLCVSRTSGGFSHLPVNLKLTNKQIAASNRAVTARPKPQPTEILFTYRNRNFCIRNDVKIGLTRKHAGPKAHALRWILQSKATRKAQNNPSKKKIKKH